MQMLVDERTLAPADEGVVADANSCFVPRKDIDESTIVVRFPHEQCSVVILDWNIGSEPIGLDAGMPLSHSWDVSGLWKGHGRGWS